MRLGLHLVKGLSRGTANRLVCERERYPFLGIIDLGQRVHPAVDEWQILLEAGAFDALLGRWTPAQRAWLVAKASRTSGRPLISK